MNTTCSAPQKTGTPPRQCLTWRGLVLKYQLAAGVASIPITRPRPTPPHTTPAPDGQRVSSKVPQTFGAPWSAGGGSTPAQSRVHSRSALPRSQSVCRARPPSALPPRSLLLVLLPGCPAHPQIPPSPLLESVSLAAATGKGSRGAQQHLGGHRGSPTGAGARLSCPSSLSGRISSLRRPLPLRPRL